MKRLLYILVFLASVSGIAQNSLLFEQGKERYKEEKYQEAIDSWMKILENGEHSANLYFNLGNAHYKLNNVGPSIYYYEKAAQLSPLDRDIKTNLAFAENSRIDAIEPLPKTIFSKWYTTIATQFTFDGWALLAVLFSGLFSILFLGYYFAGAEQKKRLFFTTAIICGCLFVLVFTMASVSYKDLQKNVFAIVFSEATDVKSEPKTNSDTIFVIHEGTKVQLLETDGLWTHVAIVNGVEGWMPSAELKKL